MISGALAESLARHRDYYNQRFQVAAANYGLEAPVFSEMLAQIAAPTLAACEGASETSQDRITRAVYDALLMLAAMPTSVRTPPFREAVSFLLPAYAGLLGTAPNQALRLLVHAALRVFEQVPQQAPSWAKELASLAAPGIALGDLRSVGVVLAWRYGLAQFRDAALGEVKNIESSLLARFFDCSPRELEARVQDFAARHFAPREALEVVLSLGGFSGLGGPFSERPKLVLRHEKVVVLSGEDAWGVHVDRFGSHLERVPAPLATKPAPVPAAVKKALRDVGSVAECVQCADFYVATSTYSYQVHVLA